MKWDAGAEAEAGKGMVWGEQGAPSAAHITPLNVVVMRKALYIRKERTRYGEAPVPPGRPVS